MDGEQRNMDCFMRKFCYEISERSSSLVFLLQKAASLFSLCISSSELHCYGKLFFDFQDLL